MGCNIFELEMRGIKHAEARTRKETAVRHLSHVSEHICDSTYVRAHMAGHPYSGRVPVRKPDVDAASSFARGDGHSTTAKHSFESSLLEMLVAPKCTVPNYDSQTFVRIR